MKAGSKKMMNTERTTMKLEIFAHDISVTECDDAPGVFMVQGKDWESQPFDLYLREDEAKSLLVQLGFQVYEKDRNYDV